MNNLDRFPLTFTQEDIYFHQALHPTSALYAVGGYLRCGRLDVERIRQAHREVIRSHDAFGMRIVSDGIEVVQHISQDRTLELPVRDFSGVPDPQAAANAWVQGLFDEFLPYDNCELFRSFLVRLDDQTYWYAGVAHHLCLDGWGFANWASELHRIYTALGDDARVVDACEQPRWKAVSLADQRYVASATYAADRDFWQKQCSALPDRLLCRRNRLASDAGIRSSRFVRELPGAQIRDLQRVAEQCGLGLPQLVLGILAAYVAIAYSQRRFVFGIPVHNRKNHDQKRQIGVFTSVSPLVLDVDESKTLAEVLGKVAALQRSCYRHQRYPLGHLLRDLGMAGVGAGIYDVSFNYLCFDQALSFDGVAAELTYLSHHREGTPLTFTLWSGGADRAEIQIDYNTAYFRDDEIALLIRRIAHLLEMCEANLSRPLGEIDVLPQAERRLLVEVTRGSTPRALPAARLHQWFEQQVLASGDRVAVACADDHIRYANLNARANRLGYHLADIGVVDRDVIGICLDRSPEVLVAMLATLKAGAAFIVLDAQLPVTRLQHMVLDARIAVVITQQATSGLFADVAAIRCVELDAISTRDHLRTYPATDRVAPLLTEDCPAYVMYTSGSSGVPKGTIVGNRAIVSHVLAAIDALGFRDTDTALQLSSFAFDTSLEQTFAALLVGATLQLHAGSLPSGKEFFDLVGRHRVTITDLPLAYLSQLVMESTQATWQQSGLSRLVVGGEALSGDLVERWFERGGGGTCQLYNAYGPTEAVITATLRAVTREDCQSVRIGRVLGDRQLHVLDRQQRLCPIGVVGELYIGGTCIADGYLNRPDVNRERFVADSVGMSEGGRLYRTGDLVRLLPDGDLEFAGRLDEQVKLRGFRIELAEIEQQVLAVAAVHSCVVQLWDADGGDARLVTHLKLYPESAGLHPVIAGQLRRRLRTSLPDYMVPSAFVVVENWPLTPSGKIDRTALPAPQRQGVAEDYRAPATAYETGVAEIWAKLLRTDAASIGATDHFFDRGGHSLLAMRLRSEVRARYDVDVSMKEVFDQPTVETMAALIERLVIHNYMQQKSDSVKLLSEGIL